MLPLSGNGESTVEVDGVVVVKVPKRRTSVGYRLVDGRLTLRVPARYTKKDIAAAIDLIRKKIGASNAPRRKRRTNDDASLRREAEDLNRLYFNAELEIVSIRYAQMESRRGSCTSETKTIRISSRLASVPDWVRRAVVHHELCHLIQPNHGPSFRDLESRYPLRAAATDYLTLFEVGPPDGARVHLSADERDHLVRLLDHDDSLADLSARLRNLTCG